MRMICDKCDKVYDDARCWTICPHPSLDEDIRNYPKPVERTGQGKAESIVLMAVGKLCLDVKEMRKRITPAKDGAAYTPGTVVLDQKEIDTLLSRVENCLTMIINE